MMIKILFPALAILMFGFAPAAAQSGCRSILQQAFAFYRHGDFDRALQSLQDVETCDYNGVLEKERQALELEIFQTIQEQKELALAAREEAESVKDLAEAQRRRAEEAYLLAEEERIRTQRAKERLSRLQFSDLSRRVALQSRQMAGEDTLRALLARTAYSLFRDSSGRGQVDPQEFPEIFPALYYGYRSLRGRDFNRRENMPAPGEDWRPAFSQLIHDRFNRRLYTSGPAGGVRQWGLDRLRRPADSFAVDSFQTYALPPFLRQAIALSRDGGLLAVAGRYPRVFLFSTDHPGKHYATIPVDEPVRQLAFTPDGRGIYIGTEGGALSYFSLEPGEDPISALYSFSLEAFLEGEKVVRLSLMNDYLVLVLESGRLLIWQEGFKSPVQAPVPAGPVTALETAYIRGGSSLIAVGQGDGRITLLAFKETDYTLAFIREYQHHRGRIADLAFSPDHRRLAAAGYDERISVMQIGREEKEALYLDDFENWVTCVDFIGNEALVAGDRDGLLHFFSLQPEDYLDGINHLLKNKKLREDEWKKYFNDLPVIEDY